MNNKKHKKTLALIVSLIAISGGMFAYQNFYMPHRLEKQKTIIYVAKNDIQAFTPIAGEDMFDKVKVNKDSVLPSYVTDISKTEGLKLKGGLLKGEPLTMVRLTDKALNENEKLTFNIEPDYIGDLNKNDTVKVYVLLTDKNSGEVSVKVLFEDKKLCDVIKDNSGSGAKPKFVMNGTDNEIKDYYVARETGKIIVTKVNSLDVKEINSNDAMKLVGANEKFDANSNEVKNAKKIKNKDGEAISVVSYEVQAGDTVDALSMKFKTTKQQIIDLNDGKSEFDAGESITVPAI